MGESGGSIGFFATYRPPLDLYSSPIPPTSARDEVHLTDGESYNYNGHLIPRAALKEILGRPRLTRVASPSDVDSGQVSGMIFVSERTQSLKTLHIAIRFNDNKQKPQVFNFAEVYGTFDGARMEDSPCFAGDYLVYVSTKEDPKRRGQQWNAVYRTHLVTGETERLTPPGEADFSPSVPKSGGKIALATLPYREGGWNGEIEDLKTDILKICKKEKLKNHLCQLKFGPKNHLKTPVGGFLLIFANVRGVLLIVIVEGLFSNYRLPQGGFCN